MYQQLKFLALSTVQPLRLDMVACEYQRGKRQVLLKVVITSRQGYVTLDTCDKVAALLSARLDVENLVPQPYTLVVESAGLDRTFKSLEEYSLFCGKEVRVVLRGPLSTLRKDNIIIGTLQGLDQEDVLLMEHDVTYRIPLANIAKTQLYCDIKKLLSQKN